MRILTGIFILIAVNFSASANAGMKEHWSNKDSSYIESYYKDLIVRIYSGEKSHSLELSDLSQPYRLQYLPNGYFNMGIGVNFRSFGLSLATKIPFIHNNQTRNGVTKRVGFQSYMYTDRFSVDVLTSFLKGYYLRNTDQHLGSFSKNQQYQRPDISSANMGISVNYIFNHDRFSYKAAFSDTERQKRNAGSLITGVSILSYRTRADSAFVPRGIKNTFFLKSRDVSQSGVLAFNANAGYAYSLVFFKNGIVTFSYTLGAGMQNNQFDRTSKSDIDNWRLSLNHTGRLGIGYRFKSYFARIGIIRSTQYTNLEYSGLGIANGTDFMQLSVGKRLSLW